MRFHSIATALKDINSPFAAASKGEEEEEYDSAADEDFSADEEDEESLGDVDTDIEEEEVNDLEADINMPATARKKSMTPKKAAKTDDVSALSGQMGKLNVSKQVKYVSLDWRFPMCMYSVMEGDCNMIYIELMKGVQLPPEYIVHAKVLPGGMQFSLLVGVPRYFYEESYMQARMGGNYSTGSALFQAFDRAVIQPIRKLFPGTSSSLEGTPQIVNLDEECVEGPVPYHFGNARTKGTQRVEKAKQYQSTMTFQLTAVKKKAVKVEKPMKFVFGYVDGDSSDSSSSSSEDEEENANMNEEQEY